MITIVIPTHNRSFLLEKALDSLRGTDHLNEVIVADDGSTEDIRSICQRYQPVIGSPVIHLRSGERKGAQDARNRGLRAASSAFVLFLDSDDVIVSHGLNVLSSALLENTELSYVTGQVAMADANLELMDVPLVGSPFKDKPVEFAGYH